MKKRAARRQTRTRSRRRMSRGLAVGWVSTVNFGENTGRYHTELMDAVSRAVAAKGGHLLAFGAANVSAVAFCKRIAEAHLDGVIVVGPARQDPLKLLLNTNIPAVLIDDAYRGRPLDAVLVDNEGGGYQAMEHLVSLGHTQLGVVTGPKTWKVTRDRLTGVTDAMEDAGLFPAALHVVESDFSPEGGVKAIRQILLKRPRPTAVFFLNDEMASAGLQTVREETDLRVPEDLSIVGFDDTRWASITQPPLTTVHVDKDLIARHAVERLGEVSRDRRHKPSTIIVPTRLEIRKSTARAPRGAG